MAELAPPLVAVVDDGESIRKALERLLRAAKLEAECFASGQAFIESLAVRLPDCLVLDLHMPGMTGCDVLRRLQQFRLDVPAIVVTAYDEPDTRAQCLAAGAFAYLRKPLDDRLLLDTIANAVRQRKPAAT
jgi:FixJ family two-component response regulator